MHERQSGEKRIWIISSIISFCLFGMFSQIFLLHILVFFFWKKTTFCHFLTLIALVVYWTYIGFNSCSWISSCQRKKITFVQQIHPQDPGDWTFLNAQKTSNNSNSGDIQMTARRLHTAQEQLLIGQTLLDVTIKHFQRAQESVLNFPRVTSVNATHWGIRVFFPPTVSLKNKQIMLLCLNRHPHSQFEYPSVHLWSGVKTFQMKVTH